MPAEILIILIITCTVPLITATQFQNKPPMSLENTPNQPEPESEKEPEKFSEISIDIEGGLEK
jgi:hypothetical protein